MQYFDTHAHVFPDHIVEKVIDTLQDFYQFKWQGKGIVSDLLARMDEAGVQRAVIFSAATKAEQVQAVNNYVAGVVAQYPDRFIGLGSIHPDYREYEAELARIRSLGLRGLKFHPDFQQIRIDQQEVVNICRAAGPDFPILFHVGDKRFDFSSSCSYCLHRALYYIITDYPDGITITGVGFITLEDDVAVFNFAEDVSYGTSAGTGAGDDRNRRPHGGIQRVGRCVEISGRKKRLFRYLQHLFFFGSAGSQTDHCGARR